MPGDLAGLLDGSANWIADRTGTRLALPLLGALAGFAAAALRLYFSHRRRRIELEPDLRKLEAKRWNEHIKLYGSFSNTLGIAIVGAAFIVPYVKDHNRPQGEAIWWMLLGAALPASGQFVIRFIQSES
ncbi:hypothetical protein MKK55_27545 [Methylobacterium sp. J-059]|jgi:hypothetical protein|uniref:hypothetical protein n=1 Tax=unclassified Methylobacterium TaxID=2615210 RepID=UPI001FBAC8E8|nr:MULTISPECIES: hypothetical protein [unclassified Methylobacterium]MCJ2042673.1 hypothetical protein [Methylobacterium sp. J-059]MCJ2078149.1 hypothetical protein [Methylobacterium sp. E-016]